jgi:hypothetical protein
MCTAVLIHHRPWAIIEAKPLFPLLTPRSAPPLPPSTRRRCIDEPGVAPPQALTLTSPRNRVAFSIANRHRLLSSCSIIASRVAASSRQAAPLRCASKASQSHPPRASPSSVSSGRPPIRLPPPRGLHRRIAASQTQSRSP